MNGIFNNNNTENKLQGVLVPRSKESIETAGSLAMNVFHSLFEVNSYDEFSSSNPFIVDYSQYSDIGDANSYGGFLSAFSNAVSTLGGAESAAVSSFSSGDSGCSSCGGFTSVC